MPVDIAMPKWLRERRRSERYAAICAVGLQGEAGVLRLATAENVEAHLAIVQPGSWRKVQFERVIWTPGLVVAQTIVTRAERFLTNTNHELGSHWYRAGIDLIDELVMAEAVRLNAPLWSHDELVAKLRAEGLREADRFAGGVI